MRAFRVFQLAGCVVLVAYGSVAAATHIEQYCASGGGAGTNPTIATAGSAVNLTLASQSNTRAVWSIGGGTGCGGGHFALSDSSPPTLVAVGSCKGYPQQSVTFSSAGTYRVQAYTASSNTSLTDCYTRLDFEITVNPAPTPVPTVTFSANPNTINSGESSVLSWSSTNATSCSGTGGWTQNLANSGSMAVSPTETTVYNLTCTGAGGTSTMVSATVNVQSPSGTSWLSPILQILLSE